MKKIGKISNKTGFDSVKLSLQIDVDRSKKTLKALAHTYNSSATYI